MPGSWVTSLTFTAGSALVGRMNVPFLQQFSLDLRPLADVPLPSGAAGPVALTVIGSHLDTVFRVQGPAGPTIRQVLMPAAPGGLAAPVGPGGAPLDPALIAARPADANNTNLITPSGIDVLDSSTFGPMSSVTWRPQPDASLTLPCHNPPSRSPTTSAPWSPPRCAPTSSPPPKTPDGTLWIVTSAGSTSTLDVYTAQP